MMKEECERHPLVKLKINTRPYITEVVFQKIFKPNMIDEIDKKIIRFLREFGELTSGELPKLIGVTKPTILKHIKKLMSLGILSSKGEGPARRYFIKTTI